MSILQEKNIHRDEKRKIIRPWSCECKNFIQNGTIPDQHKWPLSAGSPCELEVFLSLCKSSWAQIHDLLICALDFSVLGLQAGATLLSSDILPVNHSTRDLCSSHGLCKVSSASLN